MQLARYETDGDWSACMQRWVESFGDVTYVTDDECPLYNAGRWCNLNESHLRKLTHENALPYCQFVLRKARVKKVHVSIVSGIGSRTTQNICPRKGSHVACPREKKTRRSTKMQTILNNVVSPVSDVVRKMSILCRPTCSSMHHGQETRAAIYEAAGGVESDQQLSQLFREQRDILRQAAIDKQAAELKAKRQKDARDRANRLRKRHGKPWSCNSCTFVNEPGMLACVMCKTPQGQTVPIAADRADYRRPDDANNAGVPCLP